MRTAFLFGLALAGAALCAPPPEARADGTGDPGTTYASFDGARIKDDLSGNLADAAKEVRLGFQASAGSTLDATLSPEETEGATPAGGLSLALCTAAGADLAVPGSAADKSKGDGTIKWKKAPLAADGGYVLIIRATSPGGWRLKLGGALKGAKTTGSEQDLRPNDQTTLAFTGLARGSVSYALSGKSKGFEGELDRIEQPDGSDYLAAPADPKDVVVLRQDGTHVLHFRNTGSKVSDVTTSAKVKPPKLQTRRGFVRPEGTAIVPSVRSIDPPKGFNKETALSVVLSGRDFQAGADVRLTRSGRDDIIATNVVVASETDIVCVLDLDTTDTEGPNSVGNWNVLVTNAPVYTVPNDPTTLVKDTPTKSAPATFQSLASSSIRLPSGVVKKTELWWVEFNGQFHDDLDEMGFGSSDVTIRDSARTAVEAYTVLFLRDLFRTDETTGKLRKNVSVPVSFVVEKPPGVAGDPGVDYNHIEVGGAYQSGDDRNPAEPLLWGFAPLDLGNTHRDDLALKNALDVRIGHGARTRVLDPSNTSSATSWIVAMAPLRNAPLTENDRQYFMPGFVPSNQAQANRYRDIVEQVTRASREIAAIVAHHVGRAMGLAGDGDGPMANPTESGALWLTTSSLAFADGDVVTLTSNAAPTDLPGTTRDLVLTYFPLLRLQDFFLPPLTTDVDYAVDWKFVGGRPNAGPDAYRVFYAPTSDVPRGSFTLTFNRLAGKAPTLVATNTINCGIAFLRIAVEDRKTHVVRAFSYRLKVLPNDAFVPGPLKPTADACRNQVMSAP